MLRNQVRQLIRKLGYDVRKVRAAQSVGGGNLPDAELYAPLFSPWLGGGPFGRYLELAAPRTLVSADRCYVLYTLLRQAVHVEGDIWECGVYKGGTAAMMAMFLKETRPDKRLYLFDTFEGMPETNPEKDWHMKGDFSDTSAAAVASFVGCDELCIIREGFIPDTFAGLESKTIALVHIDVDIHKSIVDCLDFVWPRLSPGGFVVVDDYGFPTCPGARAAVDEYFSTRTCIPLCLPTGQALVFKGVA